MFKRIITTIIFILLLLVAASATQGQPEEINITSIIGGSFSDPAKPLWHLYDGNPSTVWSTTATTPSNTWFEIALTEAEVIDYMEITGYTTGSEDVSLQYLDNKGTWQPFTGQKHISLTNGLIDLSWNRARTNRMRFMLENPLQKSTLGNIGEIKVYGHKTDDLVRLQGQITISAEDPHYPGKFLNDGNTYTSWRTPGNSGNITITYSLTDITPISLVKFFNRAGSGSVMLSAQTYGFWTQIGERIDLSSLPTGWQIISLPPNLTANAIKLDITATGSYVGGFAEIEVWGQSNGIYKDTLLLGENLTGTTAQKFYLDELSQFEKAELVFTLPIGVTSFDPKVTLNGLILNSNIPLFPMPHCVLAKLPIDINGLLSGDNMISLDMGANIAQDVCLMLTTGSGEIGVNSILSGNTSLTGLFDGNRYSGNSISVDTFEINLAAPAQVNQIKFYYQPEQPLSNLTVAVWQNNDWVTLDTAMIQTDGTSITICGGTPVTGKIRIQTPNIQWIASLSEVEVYGSSVNSAPPRINITNPPMDSVITSNDNINLEGFVDNPEAVLTVNGTNVSLQGHYFAYPITVPAGVTGPQTLTLIATDSLDQSTTLLFSYNPSSGSGLTCELPEISYTTNSQIVVKGTVSSALTVQVNATPATLSGGSYSGQANLTEGENRIHIEAVDFNGVVTRLERKAVRDTQAPVIRFDRQLDGLTVTLDALEIAGICNDITTTTLLINGQEMPVVDGRFLTVISLTPGQNTIDINAYDQVGNTNHFSIKVIYTVMGINIANPTDGSLINTSNITVTGSVTGIVPARLSVNGVNAQLSGETFSATIALDEGEQSIVVTVEAADGNQFTQTRNIIIDSKGPEPFKVTMEPTGWTNNPRPVFSFETKDAVSGVDHYEIRIDEGAWINPAVSPYQFPQNIPDGSHTVDVKAVDKAGNRTIVRAGSDGVISASGNPAPPDYSSLINDYINFQITQIEFTNPYESYFKNSNESVSPTTGDLSVDALDLALPGRDGFDIELCRSYRSDEIFNYYLNEVQQDNYKINPPIDTFGIGWTLNIPWIARKGQGYATYIYLPTGQFLELGAINTTKDYNKDFHQGIHFNFRYTLSTRQYTLTMRDGTQYVFDNSGKNVSKINFNGKNTIQYTYNGRELSKITDSINREITFTYKTVGTKKLIGSIQFGGRTITYNYDSNNLLTEVIDPLNRKTKYKNTSYGSKKLYKYVKTNGYNLPQDYLYDLILLENITYPTGVISSYTYDVIHQEFYFSDINYRGERVLVNGHTIGSKHTGYTYTLNSEYKNLQGSTGEWDYVSEYAIKDSCILETVVSETRKKIKYKIKHLIKKTTSYSFSGGYYNVLTPNGQIWNVMYFPPYSYTNYNYQFSENPILYSKYYVNQSESGSEFVSYIGPLIDSCQVFGDDQKVETINYKYNQLPLIELSEEQHVRGGQEKYKINTTYNDWGIPTVQTDGRTGLKKEITYFSHATVKNLPETVKITNRNLLTDLITTNTTTTYKYHATYLKPESITVFNSYNDSTPGLVHAAVLPRGIVTWFTYYGNGNLKTKVSPNGLTEEIIYDQTYQAFIANWKYKGIIDANKNALPDIELKYGYNFFGLRQWEMDGRGYVTYYCYDDLDRITRIYLPDDNDTPFVVLTAEPAQSNKPYREYIYTDNVAGTNNSTCEYWNENRQKMLFTYDGLGRLIEASQYNDMSRYTTDKATTVYNYNDLGQLDNIVNPRNYATQYRYDGLDRITEVIFPTEIPADESVYATLEYDDLTNTVKLTQENGNVVTEQKDWADRLIKATRQCVFGDESVSALWEFKYDSLGNKIRQINPGNQMIEYNYSPLGYLNKISMPQDYLVPPGTTDKEALRNPGQSSPQVNFIYNDAGQKISETDANGNKTEYGYDGLGRLITVTNKIIKINITTKQTEQVTAITRYFYDASGNKIQTIDPNGHEWKYTYSARGFLLSEEEPKLQESDPGGNKKQYRYDPVGNRIAEIDLRNITEAPKVWYSYDADKELVLSDIRSDKTYTTWYLYDEYNRLYRTVMPDNTPPENPFGAASGYDNPYTETRYDLVGNKVEEQNVNGLKTSYTYYPRNWVHTMEGPGRKEEYEYDKTGNQTLIRVWTDIANNISYTVSKEYDSLGRLRRVTYPQSQEEYQYDSYGNRTAVTDGNGHTTQYTYNSYGWLTQVTDPLQKSTVYRYDLTGNQVATITANDLLFIKRYDEQKRVIEEIDSLGRSTICNYDLAGNPKEIMDRRGTKWVYGYHNNNRLSALNLTGTDNVTQYTVSYDYDKAGNILKVTDNHNTIIYNDQISDPLNRLNSVERRFDGKTYRTEYEYNKIGQLRFIKYPEAIAKIEYNYDSISQLNEVKGFTAPAGIGYDDDGLLKSLTLANNVTTSFDYDGNRRLQNLNVTGNQDIIKFNFMYDLAGNITKIYNGITSQDYRYDYYDNNQLKTAITPGSFLEEASGRVGYKPADYLGQKSLDFSILQTAFMSLDYNASSIGLDFGVKVTNIKKIQLTPDASYQNHHLAKEAFTIYFSDDNSTYTLLPPGGWEYSAGDKGVINITLKDPASARYVKIHAKCDDRDGDNNPAGNPQFINELAGIVKVYQGVNEQKEEYQYDAAGNRIKLIVILVQSKVYDSAYYSNSDRLKTDGRFAFIYDSAGNLVAKGNTFTINGEQVSISTTGPGVEYWEYKYDLLNRLIEVRKNESIVANYEYDPDGLRVVKKTNTDTIHYVFEGTEPIFEKNINTGKIKSYVYALGKHLARVDGVIGDSEAPVYFYHTDQVGSIRALTDRQGQVVWNADYLAFGSQYGKEGAVDELHGFTGKEYDPDTGLYYYNARWYDSELGRFISEDPAADPNNPNLYVYCANGPVNHTDPTGQAFSYPGFLGGLLWVMDNFYGFKFGAWLYGLPIFDPYDLLGKSERGFYWEKYNENIEEAKRLGRYDKDHLYDAKPHHEWTQLVERKVIDPTQYSLEQYINDNGPIWATEYLHTTSGDRVAKAADFIATAYMICEGAYIAKWFISSAVWYLEQRSISRAAAVEQKVLAGIEARKFWTKSTEFNGVKVYQRNDIINPNLTDKLGRTNLERMKQGLAPLGSDGKPINLHHMVQMNDSAIVEVTQSFHQLNSRIIHINPNSIPSGINRAEFDAWRRLYWMFRANDF